MKKAKIQEFLKYNLSLDYDNNKKVKPPNTNNKIDNAILAEKLSCQLKKR